MVQGIVVLGGHSGCPLPESTFSDQNSVIEGFVFTHHVQVELVFVQLLEVLVSSLGVVRILLKRNLQVVQTAGLLSVHIASIFVVRVVQRNRSRELADRHRKWGTLGTWLEVLWIVVQI